MSEPAEEPIADAIPEDEDLVMAMPRRELYGVQGVLETVRYEVLASLQEESWFALGSVIAEDLDAKEVRIGALIKNHEGHWLVDEHGVLLHSTPVPAEIGRFGEGLMGIRQLASHAVGNLLEATIKPARLVGYLNDDNLVDIRPFFTLIYICECLDSEYVTPGGMSWVSATSLTGLQLEPVSQMIQENLNWQAN